MANQKRPLNLDRFYQSRQAIAGELGTVYAQRQVAGIRQLVQEEKLAKATAVKQEKTKKEAK